MKRRFPQIGDRVRVRAGIPFGAGLGTGIVSENVYPFSNTKFYGKIVWSTGAYSTLLLQEELPNTLEYVYEVEGFEV